MTDEAVAGGAMRETTGPEARRLIAALVLVVLADVLFWETAVGVSLAVFASAIFALWCLSARPGRRGIAGAGILFLGLLPVVEYVQPLSVIILLVALLAAVAVAAGAKGGSIVSGAMWMLQRWPFVGVLAGVSAFRGLGHTWGSGAVGDVRAFVRGWALPVGGTLVFGALLIDANPVLERLLRFEVDTDGLGRRIAFWAGVALMIWPFVDGAPVEHAPIMISGQGIVRQVAGVNAASTERALWMFNALIAVQTVMDLSILSGGARLPEGMGFAEYAHRGAYPLLATALLAGVFAVLARPFAGARRGVRVLLMLWLGQNVLLCLAAVLRLELYVGAYGLTYLRIYAFIWMGLVAAGLVLIGWQVWRMLPMRWLVVRLAVMAGTVLYLCTFVNFAEMIARHNLAQEGPKDWGYLCWLGEMAAVPMQDVEVAVIHDEYRYRSTACPSEAPVIDGWRDWGWRKWRVARAVGALG